MPLTIGLVLAAIALIAINLMIIRPLEVERCRQAGGEHVEWVRTDFTFLAQCYDREGRRVFVDGT